MKLTFLGATGIVTGSCYLLETTKTKILIDCGMFQGTKDITRLNYESFNFDPKEISFMLLTHAHIDHSGLIPKLVKNGFNGKIYATPPTIDLAKLMLQDTAHVNMDETEQENKRRIREGLDARSPLYTVEDVDNCAPFFYPINYEETKSINEEVLFKFRNAGHILGSSFIELTILENNKKTKIVFSGELGGSQNSLLLDPSKLSDTDFLLIESTYGGSSHGDSGKKEQILLDQIISTYKKGGKLLIPSFTVERAQEIIYYIHKIAAKGNLPEENVYLDSPLAIDITEVFRTYESYFKSGIRSEFNNKDLFSFPELKLLRTPEESKSIDESNDPYIVIAGNGMCTAGRIREHLKFELPNPKSTVLLVGYQAEGSLGRYLLNGVTVAKMMGLEIPVKASIVKIDSFSAHADENGLINWIKTADKKPTKIFLVHGETDSAKTLENRLNELGYETHIPFLNETVVLE